MRERITWIWVSSVTVEKQRFMSIVHENGFNVAFRLAFDPNLTLFPLDANNSAKFSISLFQLRLIRTFSIVLYGKYNLVLCQSMSIPILDDGKGHEK